jgi:uncharacterized phage infection (PIP) family protein YhgE
MEALRDSKTWGILAAVAVGLAVVIFGYLGAVVSPEENTEDLPIAVVNADQGAKVGGEEVNFGDRIVQRLTGFELADDGKEPPMTYFGFAIKRRGVG